MTGYRISFPGAATIAAAVDMIAVAAGGSASATLDRGSARPFPHPAPEPR